MQTITRTTCRICESPIKTLFNLGDLYVSTFVKKGEEGIKAPLEMTICENKECELVQLRHTAPQELMYSGHYWYRSALNPKIVNDLKEIVGVGIRETGNKDWGNWLDIGANDGTLLSFVPKTYGRWGVEPAKNLSEELAKHCSFYSTEFWEDIPTIKFPVKTALGTDQANIITAIGMFYDSENPNKFISKVRDALSPNGVFISQLMTLYPMIEKNDLGNICHEHLEYYSYKSLVQLFERNGLEIYKVEENDINGGSYRLFARHYKTGSVKHDEPEVDFQAFYDRLVKNREEVKEFIKDKKVYGYGASTKFNTILQWYDIKLEGIADKSQEKWGLYTIGTQIPIISEDEARKKARYFLIGPWGFADVFLERELAWRDSGGLFITHTPTFKVL